MTQRWHVCCLMARYWHASWHMCCVVTGVGIHWLRVNSQSSSPFSTSPKTSACSIPRPHVLDLCGSPGTGADSSEVNVLSEVRTHSGEGNEKYQADPSAYYLRDALHANTWFILIVRNMGQTSDHLPKYYHAPHSCVCSFKHDNMTLKRLY